MMHLENYLFKIAAVIIKFQIDESFLVYVSAFLSISE